MTSQRAIFRTRKTIFTAVNTAIYFTEEIFSFATSLNEIRLAIEAIRVPKPPRFTPMSRLFILSVKPERRMAAGTFEKIWLAAIPTATSFPSTVLLKNSLTGSMFFRLPMNMKRKTNVSKREYFRCAG